MLENLVYDISNYTKWFSKIFLCDSKIITPNENNPVDIAMCDLKNHLVWLEKSSRVIILLDIFVSSRVIIKQSHQTLPSRVIIKIITQNGEISCDYKNDHTRFQYFLKYCVIIFIITQDGVILCDYKILKNFRNLARKLYKAYTSTSLECWPLTNHILYINLPTDSLKHA